MRIASIMGTVVGLGLLTLAACGGDEGGDTQSTGGASGAGGSGTGGSAGSGTGGSAGSGTGGSAGSGTGGSGTGGTGGSGTGGSGTGGTGGSGTGGTGGSGTGGSGTGGTGGLSAGPGQFNYKGEVNGQSIGGSCTPKNNSDADSYSTVIAGNQLNVGCPGVIGTAIANPGAYLILKSYASLPATFSFTKADASGTVKKYELGGWAAYSGAKFNAVNKNTESIDVTGTYDGATKRVTAKVNAKWGPSTSQYEAQGWLEIAFDVTHP